MKPLSIAMVAACPFPANHGTPALIRETSQAVSSLGHTVHVVAYPMGQGIPVEGITVHRGGRILNPGKITVGPTYYRPILDLLVALKVCSVIWKEKIDIIHAHNYEGALAGYLAKIITRRPMLYNAVNTMSDELPSYNFIRPKSLAIKIANFLDNIVPKMGDHVMAISEELHEFLLQKGLDRSKLTLVPAGVNPAMFENKDGNVMRTRYNIGTRPLVVYTGTLDAFQGIDLLLKAMRIVVESIPDPVLLVVGSVINHSDLASDKRLAEELGIQENVIFSDEHPFEDVPYFLASADVTVVPRPSCPGFPIKLLNYMAAGKAIVTFEGSAKGLKDMSNAVVVPDNDWREFGKGILRLLQDPELAKRLGDNARATIQGTFDWATLARKIEKIYEQMLD